MRRPSVWVVGGDDLNLRIPFCERLVNRGFDVTAVGTGAITPFRQSGIPFKSYALHRRVNPFEDLRSFVQLSHLVRSFKPDIVHGFDTKPSLLAAFAAAKARCSQAVRTINGMGYVFSSRSIFAKTLMPIYYLLQKAAKPCASATIFQNGTDMSYFLARGLVEESKAVLIRTSGIDIEDFTSKIPPQQDLQELRMNLSIEDKLVVTVVSRLTKQKGIPTFLEACKIITKTNQHTVFLLVGGVEEEGFQAVPRKTLLEQEPHVKLLGHRTDVAAILKITDVFVLPTEYREGVPRVLLEAGVMGCPMITTDMPGCRDVVRHGWNGIVVKPSCPEELARAIQVLLQNREMRAEFGSRSMAYIREHFAMDNIVDLHVDLYEKLLRVERRNQCARTLIPQ